MLYFENTCTNVWDGYFSRMRALLITLNSQSCTLDRGHGMGMFEL